MSSPICQIRTLSQTSTSLTLQLSRLNEENKTFESPTFYVFGTIRFQFRIRNINSKCTNFAVCFTKIKRHAKLNYTIVYTHWTGTLQQFITADGEWNFVSPIHGDERKYGNITVEVKLTPLTNSHAVLYEDTALTDFKIVGDDGFVLLHKAIAAAQSPFFKTMFEGKWREAAEGVTEVPGTSQSTLKHLKEYMYLGTVPKNCEELLLLAKYYMMDDLESRCLLTLRSQLTKDNFLQYLKFAITHDQLKFLYEILDSVKHDNLVIDTLYTSTTTTE